MRFSSRLIPGTLIQRYKRFLADVRLDSGDVVTAHCTNTGSMTGCKEPGSRVYLSARAGKGRKLPFTWELIRVGRTLMGINTLVANRLVREAIDDRTLAELNGYQQICSEPRTSPGSRLDFLLSKTNQQCYVEVKNVTLVANRVAMFPDAVTTRGTKHLKELIRLKHQGHRAVLIFVIQRKDCSTFRPANTIDPEYDRWLREAVRAGVEALPYRAVVTTRAISLECRIPLGL